MSDVIEERPWYDFGGGAVEALAAYLVEVENASGERILDLFLHPEKFTFEYECMEAAFMENITGGCGD